jgi:adenosine kinase
VIADGGNPEEVPTRISGGRLVVTGSVAYDYLMRFPGRFTDVILPEKLDRLSVSFLVDEMRRSRGGCAPNIAYGLALLGERPYLLGSAGHDAADYRDWLSHAGVDTSGLRLHDDIFTASFFVSTDQDQNQIASFYTGAMERARDLGLPPEPAPGLVVIAPNDPAAMARMTRECRERRIPFAYDPSQQVARLSGEDLVSEMEEAWLLVVNDYEMGILAQKTGLSESEMLTRVEALVVTHGAAGSVVSARGPSGELRTHRIPAASLRGGPVDPTGVGDAYRAGLLRGLRLGMPWPVAGRMGSVAASYAMESVGGQPEAYSLPAFVQRYEENYGSEPALAPLTASGSSGSRAES